MLNLDNKLTLDAAAIKSTNLCDKFSAEDLQRIGDWCWAGYAADKESRSAWERRTEAAMDLALQIQKDKIFPWAGCSNIAFPLVTIAALQFHSRAYPALVSGTEVVKCRVIGADPDGEKASRAERVATHMSWQRLEEDQAWEEQTDRALLNVAIVGTAFKKSFRDNAKGYNVSELVLARDLVLAYNAKSVEECPRKTHVIPLSRNVIHERVLRGTYRDVLEEGWYKGLPQTTGSTARAEKDNRQGVTPPRSDETTDFSGLEMHVSLDLDGDGYAEPYIITLEEVSHTVLRIVTRFDREVDIERVQAGPRRGKIIRVSATEYFTKLPLIPSPDGGIYDIGFGVLLGPLNESTNSIVNQLVDAGTMSVTAGGFLGRGAKIRGGVYTFSPFGWQRVDSTGDDLQKNIFPLPVREPSMVLFQLLGFIVNYTSRISGSTDIMVGENPGQNTPLGTSQMLVEQGEKIYNALFKRLWRSLKEEYKKLYQLNAQFMAEEVDFGAGYKVSRQDYLGNPDAVAPASDPNLTSEQGAMNQAQALLQRAGAKGGYDTDAVERRFLRAIKVSDIEQVFPGTKGTPPPEDVRITLEKTRIAGKVQLSQMELEASQRQWAMELMEERRMNDAELVKLYAEARKLEQEAKGVDADNLTNMINAQVAMAKQRGEALNKRIDQALKFIEMGMKNESTDGGGMEGLVGASGDGGAAGLGGAETAGLEGAVG